MRLIDHCCAIDRQLFTTQYSTRPAGKKKNITENAIGMISTNYIKDSTDTRWDNDAGMKEFKAFMAKHMPKADITDLSYVFAYSVSRTMHQVLIQCGTDFSRENVMKQAANLKDLENPMLLPGIKVNTSPADHVPVDQMQLMRFNGKTWDRFGELQTGN